MVLTVRPLQAALVGDGVPPRQKQDVMVDTGRAKILAKPIIVAVVI